MARAQGVGFLTEQERLASYCAGVSEARMLDMNDFLKGQCTGSSTRKECRDTAEALAVPTARRTRSNGNVRPPVLESWPPKKSTSSSPLKDPPMLKLKTQKFHLSSTEVGLVLSRSEIAMRPAIGVLPALGSAAVERNSKLRSQS